MDPHVRTCRFRSTNYCNLHNLLTRKQRLKAGYHRTWLWFFAEYSTYVMLGRHRVEV